MGKEAVMTQFGAKLTNLRWGWDGTREDGTIIFIGWEDNVSRNAAGDIESCVIYEGGHAANESLGGRERGRHIQALMDAEAAGYLIIATAHDIHKSPRSIASMDERLHTVRLELRGENVHAVPVAVNSAPTPYEETRDEDLLEQIHLDANIAETEKTQLAQARRGQGLFRARVELIEPGCRLTGVQDRAHLRASHIKPWRSSSNAERLDGHNGLLLAPHIDHLFDRGFISFGDDGKLQVSPSLDTAILQAWGIDPSAYCGEFTPRQQAYMMHHREHIFLNR